MSHSPGMEQAPARSPRRAPASPVVIPANPVVVRMEVVPADPVVSRSRPARGSSSPGGKSRRLRRERADASTSSCSGGCVMRGVRRWCIRSVGGFGVVLVFGRAGRGGTETLSSLYSSRYSEDQREARGTRGRLCCCDGVMKKHPSRNLNPS